jgi:excisionase family DNA binding protein
VSKKPQPEPELLKVSEVARKLNCSKRTVIRRIEEGTFEAVKEGGRFLVHAWSVSAHLASLQRVGGGK